jgi:hypothetical protein
MTTPDSSETPESPKPMPSREDYWQGVRGKPDSWWAALPRTILVPRIVPDSPPKKPPSSPTKDDQTTDSSKSD